MTTLSLSRPVFHSEADFQHAFAWQLHEWFPAARLRLEYPFQAESEKWIYVDIWMQLEQAALVIELKYKTLPLHTDQADGAYRLKSHGAQDLGRYDYLKDVVRLERIQSENSQIEALAILLTNDPTYWKESRSITIDNAFRLHEGRAITGSLAWAENAGEGSTKGRTEIITLRGNYSANWQPYSDISNEKNGEFRYLAFRVEV